MVVFMVGYMGSGKTSIGRELAKAVGFRFVDMDRLIEDRCGKTISEIFAAEGEECFRRYERETLEGFKDCEEDLIVATGGGVPCHADNMELINRTGTAVYLKMEPRKLVARLEHGRDKRPIIRGMDDEQLLRFIEKNLAEREPFYSQASVVIDCNGRSDKYIITRLAGIIRPAKTNPVK